MPAKKVLMDTAHSGIISSTRSVQDVLEINSQTTSYTLVLSDQGRVVEINNAGATVLTVPLNSSVAFPIGTVINICRVGAGTLTVAGAVGVTVNTSLSLSLRAQWSEATLRKRAADLWVLSGDLT